MAAHLLPQQTHPVAKLSIDLLTEVYSCKSKAPPKPVDGVYSSIKPPSAKTDSLMFRPQVRKALEGYKIITNHSLAFHPVLKGATNIRQQEISDYKSITESWRKVCAYLLHRTFLSSNNASRARHSIPEFALNL